MSVKLSVVPVCLALPGFAAILGGQQQAAVPATKP